jgi:hypothetical protein
LILRDLSVVNDITVKHSGRIEEGGFQMRVEEAYEQWIELKTKFYEFASKHGVKVPN